MSRSLRAHLLLFAVVAAWGASFVLVKGAFQDITPLLFNFIRMTLAFLILAAVYRRQWMRMSYRTVAAGAIIGFFLALGYELQNAGLQRTSPSNSAFITGLTVVLVPLFAALPALRRRAAKPPRWNVWAGALLAFAGIVLLTTRPSPKGGMLPFLDLSSIHRGDLLTLGCSVAFALHIIVQDRILDPAPDPGKASASEPGFSSALPSARIPFQQLAVLQIGFSAVFMGVAAPLLEKPHFHLSPRAALALAVAAVLCTAVAFSIQSWVQQFLPPTHLALIYAFEPVFAWLTSLILLGEGLGARASVGAVLILAGIGAAELIHRGSQTTWSEGIPSP